MVPVLLVCIGVFAVNLGLHLAAMVGVLREFSPESYWALHGVVILSGAAAIMTHPKSQMDRGHATLGIWPCLKVLQPPARWSYVALLVYSLGAALLSFPGDGGHASFEELQHAPYFFTAFMLVFTTLGLVASHSAVLFYNHPFGFDEP